MIVNPMIYSGKKLPELENPGTAADLLAGKQLVDQYGNPLTGTMPEVAQATPSVSVSSSGLITARVVQDAGHVAAGTKSATKQLTTQAAKTVTPTTTTQQAVAKGRYTTGIINVAGDSNLKAENIKSGISIFGVTGTFSATPSFETASPTVAANNGNTVFFNAPSDLQDVSKLVSFTILAVSTSSIQGYVLIYLKDPIIGRCAAEVNTKTATVSGYATLSYDSSKKQLYIQNTSIASGLLESGMLNVGSGMIYCR